MDKILRYRNEIEKEISQFLAKKTQDIGEATRFGMEICQYIERLSLSGKMVRGQLLIYFHDAMGGKNQADAICAAAAMELFQTGLVIHDDIMDRDERRRGLETIHTKYRRTAADYGIKTDQDNFGNSMAICAGDYAFFLATEILAGIDGENRVARLFRAAGAEYCLVTLGQMADIYHSQTTNKLTASDILNCYRYKTARYSFSLPLITGAICAGKTDSDFLDRIGSLGELIGMIYQLRDDELGIFGDPKITGKPVISDIRENKKTYYYYLLSKMAASDSRDEVLSFFGKAGLTDADAQQVKKYLTVNNLDNKVTQLIGKYRKQAEKILALLHLSPKTVTDLAALIQFSAARNK